jgi:3-oxoacyl-[acyl-carrier-protein] synthase III
MFTSPKKSGVAAPHKGPIELITNNFRIKSQNHGIIYTYKVDFIDGASAAVIESKNTQGGIVAEDPVSDVSRGSFSQLETFQKYKIINAHTQQLKQIFL